MTGYYCRYLKDYSKRAKSLFDLLSGPKDLKTVVAPRTGRARPKDSNQVPSKTPIEWTSKHQIVLESLIDDLATAPVMAYPDFSQPFVLHTDASQDGLGAVLYQRQGGVMRVIGYGSRTLNPAEKNYHLHSGKLEFLALKWAITEQFRDYLYYAPTFTVYTDNNPLTYILTSAKLNATGHRWVAELADYHFSIKYRPGKNNADADTLSRLPLEVETMEKTCSEEISPEAMSAIVQMVSTHQHDDAPWIMSVAAIVKGQEPNTESERSPTKHAEVRDWSKEQGQGEALKYVISFKARGRWPTKRERVGETPEMTAWMREWSHLHLGEGMVLRRQTKTRDQVALPKHLRQTVFTELHDNMGHLGAARVVQLARDRFYWPHLEADIEHYVTKVCRYCKAARFYLLPKIHKPGNPGRPIISGNGSPTEKISLFVDHFIKPLVPQINSYIHDTPDFLRKLEDIKNQIPSTAIIGTFDVTSLYTNIPHAEDRLQRAVPEKPSSPTDDHATYETFLYAAVPPLTSNPTPIQHGTFKCDRTSRCIVCSHHIVESNSITSHSMQLTHKTKGHITCTTTNVIYLISCRVCGIQYVGETKTTLRSDSMVTDPQSTP
ncbi:hypothetical protein BSL78_04750 [Apostichopus japonicus]|uniref:Integrase zinc-binding domain-containing protein n=1 Tax=Stichopus japonicus TaxID=307972 RepID=A0A2G8LDP3_STIJA|nr:hypothetical protein BSL78_04750 [Apostichopus japonicus]